MIKNVKFVELPGGPHGVLWTHADRINSELVKLSRVSMASRSTTPRPSSSTPDALDGPDLQPSSGYLRTHINFGSASPSSSSSAAVEEQDQHDDQEKSA